MRSVPDDVRRARLRRGPLLGLTSLSLGALALSALAPRLEPWLGPPHAGLFALSLGGVLAAAVAFARGRREPRWSAADDLAWVVALGTLAVLAGSSRAPVGPGLLVYGAAAVALARRDPSDTLVAIGCATTVLAMVVRGLIAPGLAAALPFAFASGMVALAFLAVTAQTRRLAHALADRDAVISQLSAFSRSPLAPAASTPVVERHAPARAARVASEESTRGEGHEQSWDALVERVRASVTLMAENAGVAASVQAELSGLAPPSQKIRSHLLRIAQEATTQALRHAEPRSIAITLRRGDGGVVFELLDDGAAGETTRQRRSLAPLRGRVAALGGTAEVRRADRGWVTRVRLPCDQLN
jgi:hypothetical protein